jgi:hypothetical protein
MFNKINQKLLTNHPQIWNIRLVPMLFIALTLNIIYFIIGYGSIYNIRYFYAPNDFNNARTHLEAQHALFGLILFIIIIIWLFHYLRNNPFKSYYPVTKWYLVKEFFYIIIIFISLVSIFPTFQFGQWIKMKQLTSNIDAGKDADMINIGLAFLPHNMMDYEKSYSCEENDKHEKALEVYEKNHHCAESYPERLYEIDFENYEKVYNFEYYCKLQADNGLLKSKQINAIVRRWINYREKDSIENAIRQVCKIANQYRIRFNIDPKQATDYCFADTLGRTPIYIYDNSEYHTEDVTDVEAKNELDTLIASNFYMGFDNLTRANASIHQIQTKSFWHMENIFITLYIALSLSIVLLLFRVLRFKPWIVGMLGIGVVVVLGAIISVSIDSDDGMTLLYLSFVMFCAIASVLMIKNSGSKLISAVFLIWFITFAGPLIPITFAQIYSMTAANGTCVDGLYVLYSPAHPIHHWISNNWSLINTVNIGFIICYILFLLIPLSYKWQANASE